MNLLILQGFGVDVPRKKDGDKREVVYSPGMVIVADSIPADQSAEDWIAKGLARDATQAAAADPDPT